MECVIELRPLHCSAVATEAVMNGHPPVQVPPPVQVKRHKVKLYGRNCVDSLSYFEVVFSKLA